MQHGRSKFGRSRDERHWSWLLRVCLGLLLLCFLPAHPERSPTLQHDSTGIAPSSVSPLLPSPSFASPNEDSLRAGQLTAASSFAGHRASDVDGDPDLGTLTDFLAWAENYSAFASNRSSSSGFLLRGELLSLRRRAALKLLIQTDPSRALASALPQRLRDRLPPSVQQNLEERVSGRGFFGVLNADDFDSGGSKVRRDVRMGTRSFAAYVYGRRAYQTTQSSIFLHGIAIDGLMAVHEDPMRRLEADETGSGDTAARNCIVCGDSIMSQGTPVRSDLGDRIVGVCGESHFQKVIRQIAGDAGGIHGEGGNSSYDSWSQGPKRLLYMRAAFPDDPGEPIAEGEANNLMNDVNLWFVENSYDSTSIVSDVTPLLMLPHTKEWYGIYGDTVLLADAREVARAAGFNPDNYDLDIVRHNRVPGFNWNGQSYVGGRGAWLQTSSLGITVHELGHNYGLFHANFWLATSDSVIGAGNNVEYGNSFDTMGNAAAGNYQFNVINKHKLDWLPSGFFHVVTNSGLYRIYPFDVPQLVSTRKYGLMIRKDFDRSYWAEFRQKFVQNPWTQNGILLTWDPWDNGSGSSGGGTQLLDTTPGTPAGNNSKDDSAIVLGRTFTDPSAGIHITPVDKGGSAPDTWFDVQVNLGFFPTNVPPTLQMTADSISVATGVTVGFNAMASDSNGDALAYYWDFGDLTFGTNAPMAFKKWSTAGDYVVRCVVSDLKGGIASRLIVVSVGTPNTYRITGVITNAAGQLLEGVRVHNGLTGSNYRGTYADSDGHYALANLTPSTYNLGAVKYGYTVQPFGWLNPVVVNSNLADCGWTASAKPTVTLAGTDPVAGELPLNTATIQLRRSGSTNTSLTVNYIVTGSALRSLDYGLSPPPVSWPMQITLPAGVSFTNFVVTPVDDIESEGPETVVVTLAESADYFIGPDAEVVAVILDDESVVPPTVFVFASVNDDVSDDLMIEGTGDSAAFVFQRVGSTARSLDVHYSISGTAQNGVDYTLLSNVVTIPEGVAKTTVSFNAVDDLFVEGSETVVVTLETNSAYFLDDPNSATITVGDDDPPIINIASTDNLGQENTSNTARFTITRIGNLNANLLVTYTLTGTASNGLDYTLLPGTILIPAGQATATITVTPLNDSLVEGTETVSATLAGSPSCNIGNQGTASVVIMDDELPGVTLSVADATTSESGTDTGMFDFTRTGATNNSLTVHFDVFGTAINGSDYVSISNQVTIPAGTNTAILEIIPIDDPIRETNETVILVLRTHSAYNATTLSPQTVTIVTNDSGALPGVSFALATSSGSESDYYAMIDASLSTKSTSSVSVSYSVSGGTAGGEGMDYRLPGGTLVFPAGETYQQIYLELTDDSLVESNETVIVSLFSPTNALLDAITNHVFTILDDDASVVTVAANGPIVFESGPSPGSFRFSRAGQTNDALTVTYQVAGTASAPSDCLPLGNSVTIPAGQSNVDLVVTPVDDSTPEPSESVIVTLTSAFGASIGMTNTATIWIADNDSTANSPVVSISATDPTAWEIGPDSGLLTITRDGNTNDALLVSFTVGGSAVSGSDYFAVSNSISFLPGTAQTNITITPRWNGPYTSNKTVIAALTIDGTYLVAPASAAATVTLLGGIPPSILAQPQNQTVLSGSNVSFSLVATGAPSPGYQWRFNNASLASATNSFLTLSNVPVTSAGNYVCVASNAYGVVTSSVATLTVTREPLLFDTSPTALRLTAGGLQLRLLGLAGAGPVVLFTSTNSLDWESILTNPPVVGILDLLDRGATNRLQRFYRAIEQP